MCGQRDARESECQSRHAQCISIPTCSPHAAGLTCKHAPRPACCWMGSCCFRLLWCVLQLKWEDHYLYQHPVPAYPSPQRIRVLRGGDGGVGTGCCEQTVLSKTGQTDRRSNRPNISIKYSDSRAVTKFFFEPRQALPSLPFPYPLFPSLPSCSLPPLSSLLSPPLRARTPNVF